MKFDAFYNGTYLSKTEVKIPLCDRSVYFGDGIYDAAIGRNGKIFMLEEHIKRFVSNADRLNIPIPFSVSLLEEILVKLASNVSIENGDYFVYFQLSRHSEKRNHSFCGNEKSNILATVTPIILPPVTKKLKLISYPDIRYGLCDIKTVNLLPSVLAATYAEENGADEAVFHRDGTVTECSHSNIHIVKDGIIYTHPKSNRILPGIAREHMLKTCKKEGVAYKEEAFTLKELTEADEVLITSSSKLCLLADSFEDTVYKTEDNKIGEKICMKMRKDYQEAMDY